MKIIKIRYLWPSFNDFAIKNFISIIAMTLIIATKTITADFGTMAWLCNSLKSFSAV